VHGRPLISLKTCGHNSAYGNLALQACLVSHRHLTLSQGKTKNSNKTEKFGKISEQNQKFQ